MIRQLKNIILCPLFILCIVGSIISLVVYYFNYTNSDYEHHYKYAINYHENIEEYDIEISYCKEVLDSLSVKEKNYDVIKKNYEDIIKIYEHLKEDNVDYKMVYENTLVNEFDSTVFIINSKSVLFPIILINLVVIIYLAFTREFDNSRYVFIYGEKRSNIIKKKMIASFILFITAYMLYSLLIFIFSLKFGSIYKFVLAIDNSVEFISVGYYLFKYVYLYYLFNTLFFFLLLWGISLFTRKSIYTGFGVLIIIAMIIFFAKNTNISCYLGLSLNFEVVSHDLYSLTMLSILLPISLLTYGIVHFEKTDL